MSSPDEGWERPDYPSWSGESGAEDILEQGSGRPPARWWPAVRWRRPARVAVILGVAGLLGGLAAGYAAGTLHAEKATATASQSGAAASPARFPPVAAGRAPSHSQPLSCSGHVSVARMPLQPGKPVTNVSPPSAGHDTVIAMVPSPWGLVRLTCSK